MMINLLLKRIYLFALLFLSILGFGQTVPPPPENPESGDIGAYPASPIDGYTLLLFLSAIILIAVFTMKSKNKILQ